MGTEIEAKFIADGPLPLDELAVAHRLGAARLGEAATADEVDRYLDTDDGAVGAAGWACRLRHRGDAVIVSMKGEHSGPRDSPTHRRAEVEGPATASLDPADWPMSEARDLLDRLRAGRPLVERVRLDQRRTVRAVEGVAGPIATLSLDLVTVRAGDGAAGTLFTVELELAPSPDHGTTEAFEATIDVLARHPGLMPDTLTKLERALQLTGTR